MTTAPNGESASPPSLAPRHAGILRRALILASLAPAALFLFSLFGEWFFLAEMIVNFRLQLFALLLAAVGGLLVLRARPALPLLTAALAVWCAVPLAKDLIPGPQPPPGERVVRLMSFNVLAANRRFNDVRALIREQSPDVLVLVELGAAWQSAMAALQDEFPWRLERPRSHGYGIGLYSRLPILDGKILQLAEDLTDNPALDVLIDFDGTPVRIVAVHPTSPGQQARLSLRNFELDDLAEIATGTGPTIVCGDLNCTPWSGRFHGLLARTGLRDSRRGFGYQGTFPAWGWPIRIPIDHVLVSPHFHVVARRTLPSTGSDHLPVVCDLSLSPRQPAVPIR